MSEAVDQIIFEVEEEDDGGFVASAVGESIVTQADDLDELRLNVREAVRCHFDGRAKAPGRILLNFLRQETLVS